jgi:hypothetical protein
MGSLQIEHGEEESAWLEGMDEESDDDDVASAEARRGTQDTAGPSGRGNLYWEVDFCLKDPPRSPTPPLSISLLL